MPKIKPAIINRILIVCGIVVMGIASYITYDSFSSGDPIFGFVGIALILMGGGVIMLRKEAFRKC